MPKLKPGTIWLTDEEDAAITKAAMSDPDNPPWTDEELSRMRPSRFALGRPRLALPKGRLTMRIDADVLDAFRALGPGWQTQINDFFREVVASGVLAPAAPVTAASPAKRRRSPARVVEDLEKQGGQATHAR